MAKARKARPGSARGRARRTFEAIPLVGTTPAEERLALTLYRTAAFVSAVSLSAGYFDS